MTANTGKMIRSRIPVGPWRVWASLVVGLVATAIPLAGLIIVSTAFPDESFIFRTTLEKFSIVLFAVVISLIIARPISARLVGNCRLSRKEWLIWAIGGTVVLNVVVSSYQKLAPPPSTIGEQLQSIGFGKSAGTDLIAVFLLCAVAPMAEELVYRTMVQRGLRDAALRWCSRKLAIIISVVASAWFFQTLHGDENQLNQAPVYIFFGLVTAISYEITGNFLVPVAIHAINNSYVVFAGLTFNKTIDSVSPLVLILLLFCPIIALFFGRVVTVLYDILGGDKNWKQKHA